MRFEASKEWFANATSSPSPDRRWSFYAITARAMLLFVSLLRVASEMVDLPRQA